MRWVGESSPCYPVAQGPGETIFQEGCQAEDLFIVLSGAVAWDLPQTWGFNHDNMWISPRNGIEPSAIGMYWDVTTNTILDMIGSHTTLQPTLEYRLHIEPTNQSGGFHQPNLGISREQ